VGRRMALIVATYEYDDPELRQLTAPLQDAEDLAQILSDASIGGFDVEALINRPHRTVGEAIGDFYSEARPNDLTLLYFSGHGLKDDGGRLYLAMKDTRLHNKLFTTVTAEQVDQALADSASKQKVLILDCCYAGAFPSGTRTKADDTVHVLEKFSGRGRVVLTASDATQFAFEGDSLRGNAPQSIFTRHLIAGLRDGAADRDNDGDITVDELYDYVHQKVTEERPQQRPKKEASVSGRTVIAQNIHWSLPAYLKSALENPLSNIKLEALQNLDLLFRNGNAAVRRNLHKTVELLRDNDDSRRVEVAARTWLEEHPIASAGTPSVDDGPQSQTPTATPEHQSVPDSSVAEPKPQPAEPLAPQPHTPPAHPSPVPRPPQVPSESEPGRREFPRRQTPATSVPVWQSAMWNQGRADAAAGRGRGRVESPHFDPLARSPVRRAKASSGASGPAPAVGSTPRTARPGNAARPRDVARPNPTFTRPPVSHSGSPSRVVAAAPDPAVPRQSTGMSSRGAPRGKRRWYRHPAVLAIAAAAVVFLITIALTVWHENSGPVEDTTTTTAVNEPPASSPLEPAVTAEQTTTP
jgi:hypothetical protein